MMAKWFQFDPERRPDSHFETGTVSNLVVGNEGRLLDYRRTPIRVARLSDDTGLAIIEILAFEDSGALWDLPYEEIDRCQFPIDSPRCSPESRERLEAAIQRTNRWIDIPCEVRRREQTIESLRREREAARDWLEARSEFLRSGQRLPEGDPEGCSILYVDTERYLSERGLNDIETFFTRQYVSHMNNESVKAHRIAAAKLGLAPYAGKALREPAQLDGTLSLDRRQRHLIARMAFTQSVVLKKCGRERIVLYRMESSERPLEPRRGDTVFVSASFRMDIVQEMSGWADPCGPWRYTGKPSGSNASS